MTDKPVIAGFLRMSEKSKRMNNKGKECFRFTPLSNSAIDKFYSSYDPQQTTILVASQAAADRKHDKHRTNNFMPDIYVTINILEEESKGNDWQGRVLEIIGECSNFHSCSEILAHARGLFEGNKALDSKAKRRKQVASDTKNVAAGSTKKSMGTDSTVFDMNRLSASIPQEIKSDHLRVDLTDSRLESCGDKSSYCIFSVDPPNCLDVDDAIHINQLTPEQSSEYYAKQNREDPLKLNSKNSQLFEVGVHIADVTNYISSQYGERNLGSMAVVENIVREAHHRSFTVYLSERQVPIIPPYLSHDECSLKEGLERLALSFIMIIAIPNPSVVDADDPVLHDYWKSQFGNDLAEKYRVIHYKFQKSLIKMSGAYTYDQIDSYLDGIGQTPSKISSDKPGSLLEQGTVPYTALELSVKPTPSSSLRSEVKYSLKLLRKVFPSCDSHKIIEHLMLCANACCAKLLAVRCADAQHLDGLPYGYILRRQLPAMFDTSKLNREEGVTSGVAAAKSVLQNDSTNPFVPLEFRSFPAEYLMVNPSGSIPTEMEMAHYSLGLKAYTHFTSPIRRFADQMVHACVSRLLNLGINGEDWESSITDRQQYGPVDCGLKPWFDYFCDESVTHVNVRQRQHRKYSRELAIIKFVFDQCTQAGRDEVTIPLEAVVLPFRYSEKHGHYKTDLYLLEPCKFVYPLRLHTAAQKQLFKISYSATTLTLTSNQSGDVRQLHVGEVISIRMHCSKNVGSIRKKCTISCPSIEF